MTTTNRRRRNSSRDFSGRLATQSGPRTSAPMWPRPFFTAGEWAVYTALWSYPNDSVFPTHQDLADRAWVERGTAADSVALMDELGLLERQPGERADGSTTSNTYYLVEVPTPDHLRKLEALKTQRAEEQAAKRRKRAAAKKKPGTRPSPAETLGGYGEGSTPGRAPRGTVTTVPLGAGQGVRSGQYPLTPDRGYGVDRTGGYGVDRTHESLGVTEVGFVTSRRSTTATGAREVSPTSSVVDPEKENKIDAPENEHQEPDEETAEYVKSDAHWPTLTESEQGLLDEVVAVAPLWSTRMLRKVIGSRTVREVAGRDPELVRRAFLIGARSAQTVPMRMWHVESCPHWKVAAKQLDNERNPAPEVTPPHTVPRARGVDEQPRQLGRQRPTAVSSEVAGLFAAAGLRAGPAREADAAAP